MSDSTAGPQVSPVPRRKGRWLWAIVLALATTATIFYGMMPLYRDYTMRPEWNTDPAAVQAAVQAALDRQYKRQLQAPPESAGPAASAVPPLSAASAAAPMPVFAVPVSPASGKSP
jgi:hypothetical protein